MAERKIIKGRVEKTDPKYPNNWKMTYLSSKGGYRPVQGHTGRFSPGVHEAQEKVVDVIFEWESGKADRIRLPDEDANVFDAPARAPKQMDAEEADAPLMRCLPARYKRGEKNVERAFVNPYNFVPAPPPETEGLLGQHAPAGHHRYHEERWNGRIEVEIETITPLLLPDAARKDDDNDHKTFPVRRGPDDRPYLAPTALKGMLRSAYEAITNSRLGVFRGHEDRLARRMEATEGLAMIPARISSDGQHVELLMGFTNGKPGKSDNGWNLMYAAWLPRYRKGRGGMAPWAVRYPNNDLPKHGDEVFCWLQEFGKQRNGNTVFSYWRVIHIARNADDLPAAPSLQQGHNAHQPTGSTPRKVRGIVCITNQNIGTKHDERVFILEDLTTPPAPVHTEEIPLTDELKQAWTELVRNYKKEHEGDLEKRRKKKEPCDKFFGKDPGQTAFSRHICKPGTEELKGGDLVYARVDEKGEIVGLYPVMISRELQGASPESLLPPRLRPATALDELSPADRVFGWVNQQGHGAWRGSLRIGPVRCEAEAEDAIEELGDEVDGERRGLPLAILSTPKPQQARFYVGRDACGGAQDDGLPKDKAAYARGKGLRGRKVYPHHVLVSDDTDYWDAAAACADARQHQARALQANGRQVYREYVRHPKEQDDPTSNRGEQNRSMTEWVTPGTTFTTWLEVENLGEAELGALLWLLDLPDGHHLRLGYGKPLGFGSVRVRLRKVDLVSGAGRKRQFTSLLPVKLTAEQRVAAIEAAQERFVKAFQTAIEEAYGTGPESFAQVPFIKAFLKAAKGIEDMPVHYPRTQPQPDPKGENFRWFGDNEKDLRLALPDLVASASVGLPYGAKADDNHGGGHGRERRHRGRQRGGRQRG